MSFRREKLRCVFKAEHRSAMLSKVQLTRFHYCSNKTPGPLGRILATKDKLTTAKLRTPSEAPVLQLLQVKRKAAKALSSNFLATVATISGSKDSHETVLSSWAAPISNRAFSARNIMVAEKSQFLRSRTLRALARVLFQPRIPKMILSN